MKKTAQKIFELFQGSESMHGTHGEPERDDNGVKWAIKRTARTLKGPATQKHWDDHLSGKTPLGVIPIMDNSNCHWGTIDVDEYDVDAIAVVSRVEAAKLPLVPCRSKSGGLHLFLFASEPVTAELMQGALRQIAASLGFAGSEIFPKQTKILVEKGDQGNWMVMPYFGGDFGGKLRFQYGLKKTGAEMTLDEFVTFAEKRRLTAKQIEDLRAKLVEPAPAKGSGKSKKNGGAGGDGKRSHDTDPFFNGPPCLQHMASGGFPDGGRNNALFHIGVFLRRAFPDDWARRVEEDNQRFMRPPLPEDEVKSVIRSIEKKGYEYTCNNQPMASHCDSVVCRSRKFGVGAGGAYPQIESLSKLATEPPVWFVQIPGCRIMIDAEDIGFFRKFHTKCMNDASVCFKLITDKEWMAILGEAMKKVEIIEAAPEIGRGGVFVELVHNFLTNRTIGEKKEDLLRNVPWEDEEHKRFVFSLKALEDYMNRERIQPRFTRFEISRRIKDDLGGDALKLDIKSQRNVRLWQVPMSMVSRAPELDPPNEEREVI
jgi:hypothetical protein